MSERAGYEPGRFCWVGLATSDPAGATRFYGTLFGWQPEDLAAQPGMYTALRHDGKDVAVLYRQQPEARSGGAAPHWTSYISVEDADRTAARACELGGSAVFRAGRVAAIRDPTGAIVSLWQPRARAGATLVNEIGALRWNELATSDVPRARAFYGELLGWDYEADDSGYTRIKNGARLNGGMRKPSRRELGIPPSWLPYFAVESAEQAERRAEQAGGTRLQSTTETSIGRFTVLADPQGARFGVLEGEADL
jgi:uncharacterized protein